MLRHIGLAILTCASMSITLAPEAMAQSQQTAPGQSSKSGVPASPEQLSNQFRDGFLKGCKNGVTPGVKNQSGYCSCLAKAYQNRYDGRTLAVISQLASRSGSGGPALVNLMMSPESKQCALTN